MFNSSAEYYDLIYAPFKDYASEVARLRACSGVSTLAAEPSSTSLRHR